MRTYILPVSLLLCFLPVWSLAGSLPPDDSLSAKTKADPADAALKAFIHPDTGEILTYEQWQELGIEDKQSDDASSGGRNRLQPQNPPPALKGRLVELEDGDYVIVVDAPEGMGVETKVHFDEEGRPHFRCTHKTH